MPESQRIKAARLGAAMTQGHLARAAGLSRRTIVRAEAGLPVSPETRLCLAAVLDLRAPRSGAKPPRDVAIGWLAHVTDLAEALDEAARWSLRNLDALDGLHVGAHPFRGGHLWEAQAGRSGKGHLPAVAATLDRDGTGWIPSGRRACSVAMRDGVPSILTLREAQARALAQSCAPLPATVQLACLATPFTLGPAHRRTRPEPYGFHAHGP